MKMGLVILACVCATVVHAQASRNAAIDRHWQELSASAGDPAIGASAEEARATLVEFIDYACRYCRKAAPFVLSLTDKYPHLRVVFKEFPILGEASFEAARASVAAARQPGWRAFHATLMAPSPGLSVDDAIHRAAAAAGLDLERLASDMRSAETGWVIERNLQLARSLGINSTPTLIARNGLGNVLIETGLRRHRLTRFLARGAGPGPERPESLQAEPADGSEHWGSRR
ncbi:MAG: thioredoxin domain-containing protein [Gammaproteobacteria bacterium]|nr:thioredoxin domain-containing protein [Gammaproteobacteria bacterium]